MDRQAMHAKIAHGAGFIAALDQSGGSSLRALADYGIPAASIADEAAMFALIHAMRCRIITSPAFSGDRVIGAILFARTMDGLVDGVPVPDVLIARGVVPFVKIDDGLEAECDGVQRMRGIAGLDALLSRAMAAGVYGTKARAFIRRAEPAGIADIVEQQFALASIVAAAGLMPILEPEVDVTAPDRDAADALLADALRAHLDALPAGRQVMLKLSLPATQGRFDALVDHPAVLRVIALSGGLSRRAACAALARNRGIIASFSRAFLADLRHNMSDASFTAELEAAIDAIHRASTVKQTGA